MCRAGRKTLLTHSLVRLSYMLAVNRSLYKNLHKGDTVVRDNTAHITFHHYKVSNSTLMHSQTMSVSMFYNITDVECPSHTAVHRRRPGLSCCCCSYLEQSASTRHVCTFYVCFPESPEGFSPGLEKN